MRILMTIHHAPTGSTGAPATTMALADAYRSLGHEVVGLLTFEDLPARWPEQLKQLIFPLLASLRVVRTARRVDVVDASSGDLWPFVLLRPHRRWRPAVVTRSHGLEHAGVAARYALAQAGHLELGRLYPLYHGGWRLREVAWSLRHADAALFLNREDRDYAVQQLGVDRARAHVLANGLSPGFLGRLAADPPEDPLEIVQVGSFSERKGVSYSVPAFERVLAVRPATRIAFLGVGMPAEDVLSRFSPLTRQRVRVVEHYQNDELPALLARAAIGVFPSVSEAFSKALLETMACGLAPIASATPGPRELIDDGVNGLLVPVADTDALAGSILWLVDDADQRRRLAQAARSTAQAYSWEHTARKRLELFEQLCVARR